MHHKNACDCTDNKQVKSMYVFAEHVHNTYISRHVLFVCAKIMYVLCTTHVRVR